MLFRRLQTSFQWSASSRRTHVGMAMKQNAISCCYKDERGTCYLKLGKYTEQLYSVPTALIYRRLFSFLIFASSHNRFGGNPSKFTGNRHSQSWPRQVKNVIHCTQQLRRIRFHCVAKRTMDSWALFWPIYSGYEISLCLFPLSSWKVHFQKGIFCKTRDCLQNHG